MRELQARQQFKKRLYSTPALCALLVLTLLILRGTYVVYQKKAQSVVYVQTLNKKVSELELQNSDLSANIASINTRSGIEKAIKQKFNVTAPGEHEAILVDPEASSSKDAAGDQPWYKRFWSSILSSL